MNKKKHHLTLSVKLNLLIIAIILSVSVGLVAIGYYTYRRKIDSLYFSQVEKMARIVCENLDGSDVARLVEMAKTPEFIEVRSDATEKGDPSLVYEWMEEQVVGNYVALIVDDDLHQEDGGTTWMTLADYYYAIFDTLATRKETLGVESVYVQYDEDNVTYNLIDSSGDPLQIGIPEPYQEEFAAYEDNAAVPATIATMNDHVVCTAAVPLADLATGENAALVGVDINMDDVIQERRWFLWNCILFVMILTGLAIAAAMVVFYRMLIRPLTMLAGAATRFGNEEEGYPEGNVISLDIHSNDEIEDLYDEIHSMQGRIVDYADNLAAAAAEKERTVTELRTAAQIQEAMLPDEFPAFPDRKEFDLFASMTPAREVGGDFYDFFFRDEDHLVLVIADVSGKGIPAALFMMFSKILINERATMGGSPAEILMAVNDRICENNRYNMFVTVWLGILEVSTGRMVCANAGHEYPAIRHPGGDFSLLRDRHGVVIGVKDKLKYTDYEILLQEGSSVFVYTDGVPEAADAEDTMFETDRMLQALNEVPEGSPEEILEHVHASAQSFVKDAPQFDDLTMLCLKYHGTHS